MTMDGTEDHEVDTQSQPPDQQIFIDKFNELLSVTTDPRITLTNIYKEMPITHPASICEVKARQIELQTCELQLAAISQCNEVYVLSPLVEKPVLGQLDSIDIRRGSVRLSNFCYRELFVNKRGAVRVRFKRPINVVAYSGPNAVSGVIHDISLEGCCLNTLVKQGFTDGEMRVELKVIAPSSGEELAMQIPAVLVRVTGESPPYKCIICFSHTQRSEELLSIYINQRQHEILKELRETL